LPHRREGLAGDVSQIFLVSHFFNKIKQIQVGAQVRAQ
jgi:hypothetical protein